MKEKTAVVYKYKDALYINITNRCPVKCKYCIKYRWKLKFRGYYLGLKKEPTKNQVITELKKQIKIYPDVKEIVFCGYGEPLLRWKLVKQVSKWIKKNFPMLKVRINTNGLANAYHAMDVLKELKDFVDAVSVSLNAHDEKTYAKLHETKIVHPFEKIIEFVKQAKQYFPQVVVTTIKHPEIDINKMKKLVKKLNVKFKIRPYLTSYQSK